MRKIFWVIFGVSALLLAQGNAIFKITDFPTHELCPRVSPDGTRLAYVDLSLTPFPVANIRVATIDGRNAMLSTTGRGPGTDNQYPAWFPNSAQIAYERQVTISTGVTSYSIWAVPLNSANGAQLVQNNYNFSVMPDVSVNGDVAFVTSGVVASPFPGFPPTRYGSVPPPANSMAGFMIAIQPSGQSVVVNTVPGLYPRWSPDGKMLAYSAWNPTTGWDIFVADYSISQGLINFRQITSEPGDEFAPDWSPDGNWIVYAYARPASPSPVNLFIVNVNDGTIMQETFEPSAVITMPNWAKTADGKEYIYCCSNLDGDFDIYRIVPLVSTIKGASSLGPAPGASLSVATSKQGGGGKIRVIVLNTSSDKTAAVAQGFAKKVAEKLAEWNSDLNIVSIINGADSGEPHIYYTSDEYKKVANDIALYLDGLISSEVLYSETEYTFFPAEPISSSPYKLKNIDIVVEAPAN